ncbi:L-serine ammonia-lyase [Aurantiacibacter sp. MUD61]|uniref:L-serine ammonia-lyase n=1 Tax=Aurantiacibacter sp. MUD61 TaxID=3009083 RepID=UPI0022F13DED|nr:L-serine ammonia-lyase [Aurantiacibacter sp. MUD61]
MLSVLDIFKVGLGPSSSHTVGPMRVGLRVIEDAKAAGCFDAVRRAHISLHGSLALTGVGHGVDKACILGLAGYEPDKVAPDEADRAVRDVRETKRLTLGGAHEIAFDPAADIDLRSDIIPEIHPNEMHITLLDGAGEVLLEATYYSVGGGFIASERQLRNPAEDDLISVGPKPVYAFGSAKELLALCESNDLSIEELVLANEDCMRPREKTLAGIDHIWDVMRACIERGLTTPGQLPGGLNVKRRAPQLFERLEATPGANESERIFDWLNVYAMAVNEENAVGGRVVTAPTNGAAGIIPAVLKHYCETTGCSDREASRRFLVTAAGIGILYKQRASISGAEMGCQGEVGVACSMAAAGLAAIWGGTPAQIEHAAEIGMEHNLGLTCDPVGGLVQIPCIERNAVGAVKAVNAARLALVASDQPCVSLDQVIETMRQTGLDMSSKYKETSQGGLAVNVIEC